MAYAISYFEERARALRIGFGIVAAMSAVAAATVVPALT